MEKLFWVDLEMTGLDVSREVIIEAAAVITDLNFTPIAEYHSVVKQDQSFLDGMDDWNTEHHGASGLTALVPNGAPPEKVEADLINMIEDHFDGDRPVLAGNSIHQDRLFIDKYFKNLSQKLHYRMLDVSSFKVIFNHKYNKSFSKKGSHRAVDDILESIEELKYYLSSVQL